MDTCNGALANDARRWRKWQDMQNMMKSLALSAIARGFRPPQASLDRVTELVFLKDLLAQLSIDCVLDVGANRGQFASELRSIGYTGHIVSFEPVSTEFGVLTTRLGPDRKWRGHQMALGAEEATMHVNIPRLTVMSSLLESMSAGENVRREAVEVRTLDSMLPGIAQASGARNFFLKMDTQGFDLEVFRGASGCMDSIRGLQSELSVQPLYKGMPHYLDALAAYEAAGFDLYNLSVVNRIDGGGLLEMNCFMKRR